MRVVEQRRSVDTRWVRKLQEYVDLVQKKMARHSSRKLPVYQGVRMRLRVASVVHTGSINAVVILTWVTWVKGRSFANLLAEMIGGRLDKLIVYNVFLVSMWIV